MNVQDAWRALVETVSAAWAWMVAHPVLCVSVALVLFLAVVVVELHDRRHAD